MRPFAHITTIYRATVSVPDDVFDRFGHTNEYDMFSASASRGAYDTSCTSGQNTYAHCEEWLESLDRKDCEQFVNLWHNRILQWQEQLRINQGD